MRKISSTFTGNEWTPSMEVIVFLAIVNCDFVSFMLSVSNWRIWNASGRGPALVGIESLEKSWFDERACELVGSDAGEQISYYFCV